MLDRRVRLASATALLKAGEGELEMVELAMWVAESDPAFSSYRRCRFCWEVRWVEMEAASDYHLARSILQDWSFRHFWKSIQASLFLNCHLKHCSSQVQQPLNLLGRHVVLELDEACLALTISKANSRAG